MKLWEPGFALCVCVCVCVCVFYCVVNLMLWTEVIHYLSSPGCQCPGVPTRELVSDLVQWLEHSPCSGFHQFLRLVQLAQACHCAHHTHGTLSVGKSASDENMILGGEWEIDL